jgi:hypothetical protein
MRYPEIIAFLLPFCLKPSKAECDCESRVSFLFTGATLITLRDRYNVPDERPELLFCSKGHSYSDVECVDSTCMIVDAQRT